jgi:hypothetical protein
MHSTSTVSIILPTYNRADVLERALDSVFAQTHTNWQLIAVDDGSTDDTAALLARHADPRLTVVQQANAGVYAARNAGLQIAQTSQARYITFLDSDDAWYPHHLALTCAYLDAHPDRMFVTTEYHEDLGNGEPPQVYDRSSLRKYRRRAARVGLAHTLGPARADDREHDDYLAFYSQREPLGAWSHGALPAELAAGVQLYRGHIGRHMCWGYLNWLPVTVLRREALAATGLFATHTRSAADYRFLALLSLAHEASMIALPCAVKHERANPAQALRCDHLATGSGRYRFEVNKLGFFDELYTQRHPQDRGLQRLRRHLELSAGRQALAQGLRDEALQHLGAAARPSRQLWRAGGLYLLARTSSSGQSAARLYRQWTRMRHLLAALTGGHLSLRELAAKALGRLRADRVAGPALASPAD